LKKQRASWEIQASILENLKNPSGTRSLFLMRYTNLSGQHFWDHLSFLEEKGMLRRVSIEQKVKHGSGRRLLSDHPRTIVRRFIYITPEGERFLQELKRGGN
jgi:predicted transcriptional regulator